MNHKNSRKQGDHGLGAAIAYFCSKGYHVSIPLTDNQSYDLVVDFNDGKLLKVQIKTTRYKRLEKYVADLRSRGGNKTSVSSKPLNPKDSDYIFVLTEENKKYLIPTEKLTCFGQLVLGLQYKEYTVL